MARPASSSDISRKSIDEVLQTFGFALQRLNVLALFIRLAAFQQFAIQFDIGRGRAQFVPDAGDKLIFQVIEFFQVGDITMDDDIARNVIFFVEERCYGDG